jgi:hypothetical protein
LSAWTVAYATDQKKKGERLASIGEATQTTSVHAEPADHEDR